MKLKNFLAIALAEQPHNLGVEPAVLGKEMKKTVVIQIVYGGGNLIVALVMIALVKMIKKDLIFQVLFFVKKRLLLFDI